MGSFIYKTIMFVVNFVFFLVGAGIMSFGIVLLANPSLMESALNSLTGYQNINYVINLNSLLSGGGILFTCVGSVMMGVALIGLATCCCGGSCLYIIYSVFLGLIIAFEIAVIIFLSVNYSSVETNIQGYMYSALIANFLPVSVDSLTGAISNSTSPGAAAWETMQFTYGCCGAYGPEDFQTYTSWKNNFTYNPSAIFPPSCCAQTIQYQIPTNKNQFVNMDACISSSLATPTNLNTKGCYIVGLKVVYEYGYITNIVIASLLALEIIIMHMSVHQYYEEVKDNKIYA